MGKDTTGRAATGMGRYYMDAGWYRHTRFRGLGLDSLFLIEASVGYSLEHATDGRFPLDLEDLAVAFGLRYTAVRKAAPPLFDRGIWVDRGDGEAELVGYAQHNPTKTEIEAMTEDRSKLGRLANHTRWHEKRGKVDPSCPYCTEPNASQTHPGRDPDRESRTDPQRTPNPVPNSSHGMGWDGMGSSSSSGYPQNDPSRDPDDDDYQWLEHFADAWADLRTPPGKPPSYHATTKRNAIDELADHALDLHHQHPALTPTDIAKHINTGPPDATHPEQYDYAAMAEAATAHQAWGDQQRADIEAREAAETAAIAEHGHLDTTALRAEIAANLAAKEADQ